MYLLSNEYLHSLRCDSNSNFVQAEPTEMPKNEVQEQTAAFKEKMAQVLSQNDNSKCADCGDKESKYFLLTFATFVCDFCALEHYRLFPVNEHYVKNIVDELYDPYQTRAVCLANNKKWRDFTVTAKCSQLGFVDRYNSVVALWYAKRVRYEACEKTFMEDCPMKTHEAKLAADDAAKKASVMANQAGAKA